MKYGPSHTPSSHPPAPADPFIQITTHNVIPCLHTYQLPLAPSFDIYITTTPSSPSTASRRPLPSNIYKYRNTEHVSTISTCKPKYCKPSCSHIFELIYNNEFNLPSFLLQFSNLHHTYTVNFIRYDQHHN